MEEDDGILHDPAVALCTLPFTNHTFNQLHAQLVQPGVNVLLESDRQEEIHLVVPGGRGGGGGGTATADVKGGHGGGGSPGLRSSQCLLAYHVSC